MIPRAAGFFIDFVKAGWAGEAILALPRAALMVPKLLGDRRVPLRIRTALLGLGIYLVSPFDILPDFIPGIGRLDDAIVLLLFVDGIFNRIDEKILLDHWTGRAETLRRLINISHVAASFVPRKFRLFLFGKITALGDKV